VAFDGGVRLGSTLGHAVDRHAADRDQDAEQQNGDEDGHEKAPKPWAGRAGSTSSVLDAPGIAGPCGA
jgi:hypothetical protein